MHQLIAYELKSCSQLTTPQNHHSTAPYHGHPPLPLCCLIQGLCPPECPLSSPAHLTQEERLLLNAAQSGLGPAGIMPCHAYVSTFSHRPFPLQKPYISHSWACASPCPAPFRLETRLQSHGVNDRRAGTVQHDGK